MPKGEDKKDVAKSAGGVPRRRAPRGSAGKDLTAILNGWAFDPEKAVRRVRARDGREVLQVRLPLGLEQYEIDGRPDGFRPCDQESWLHHYWEAARQHRQREEEELQLTEEDFSRLQQEGLLYYYRYLLFFQMHEYELCARDTRRNLKLLDFVSEHAPKDRAEALEQYRPYILRMNYMARSLYKIQEEDDVQSAIRLLQAGIKAIEELPSIPDNQIFEFERTRSLKSLEDLISQLEAHVPRHVALSSELERAVREENYERAAVLRDELAALRKSLKN